MADYTPVDKKWMAREFDKSMERLDQIKQETADGPQPKKTPWWAHGLDLGEEIERTTSGSGGGY